MIRKFFDSPWPYFILAGLLMGLLAFWLLAATQKGLPSGTAEDISKLSERDDLNVLFIVIDTLRADRVHAYGYERATSPNLDALAARGIRFAHVESQSSWTKTSMASLWTGMYPQRTGIHHFGHALPAQAVMPAEQFKDAGYATAGVWRNGWVGNNFGFDQGFDMYVRPKKTRPAGNVKRRNPGANALVGTDLDATTSASEFLVGASDERFFLYIHYMDVHQYLSADISPNWGSGYSDFYDSSIHWTDHNIGLLLGVLELQGMLDRTLIVIASDHGEAFFEHGMEGHARSLYGEVLGVPMFIIPPFELDEPIVVQDRVANVDLWPTVFDMLGYEPTPGTEGESLMPLIMEAAGKGDAPGSLKDRTLYSQIDRNWGKKEKGPNPVISAVKGRYKLVQQKSKEMGAEQLFDRVEDPGEQKNIANEMEDVLASMKSEIDRYLAVEPTQWDEAPEVELDEMKKNQLKALGYVFDADDFKKAAQEKKAESEAEPDARGEPATAGE